MDDTLSELLEKIGRTADFYGIKFKTINETNAFGDNALHCVCVWGDIAAARILVENGINPNQKGEGDFTPLNVVLEFGHKTLAKYLISCGADTSVIGAEFVYDPIKSQQHIRKLSEQIDDLENTIDPKCGGSA